MFLGIFFKWIPSKEGNGVLIIYNGASEEIGLCCIEEII